jgi:hypothetical protein
VLQFAERIDESVVEPVDPAVQGGCLALLPGALDYTGLGQVLNLLAHVEFHQSVHALGRVLVHVNFGGMQAVHVLNDAQPLVDDSEGIVGKRSRDPAAAVVAADDDVLDLEVVHGVLEHRKHVEVGVHHHVGDFEAEICMRSLNLIQSSKR